MSTELPQYEVYALRYADHPTRLKRDNYLTGDPSGGMDARANDPHDNALMPIDYFFWLVRRGGETILVDTGFSREASIRRQRHYLREPADLLAKFDIKPEDITKVVMTHMHYDHAGNLDLYPNATLYLWEREMAYCTGHCMCHAFLRMPFDADDVVEAVYRLHKGKVIFTDDKEEILPGISVHRIGGHTAGLQAVKVNTERGALVLASDAAHFWTHIREKQPFPIVLDVAGLMDGYEILNKLADGPDHIIPGHDPEVSRRFPRAKDDADIFALHLSPSA